MKKPRKNLVSQAANAKWAGMSREQRLAATAAAREALAKKRKQQGILDSLRLRVSS